MSDETVRTTLNQMLYKYAAQRGDILGKIQDCRIVLDDAEANLKRAHEDDRRAIHDDDQLVTKMRDLMACYNSLPNDPPRPQALLEQHAELGREQLGTHRCSPSGQVGQIVAIEERIVFKPGQEIAMRFATEPDAYTYKSLIAYLQFRLKQIEQSDE
jgi:hypothetical protein